MANLDLFFGIFLTLLASFLFNIAPILQKDAINSMEDISMKNVKRSIRSMFSNKKWLIGLLLTVPGVIFYLFAVDFVGIVVVEPLNNAGFLVLIIAAVHYLHEKLRWKDYLAIGFLILLPVFLAFSEVTTPQIEMSDTQTQWRIGLWTFILISISIGAGILGKKIPMMWTINTGVLITLSTIYTQIAVLYFENSQYLGATVSYIIAIGFNIVFTYTYQIGLQKTTASSFAPITQTIDNFFTVALGVYIFGQQIGQIAYFILGFGLGLVGALLLSQYNSKLQTIQPHQSKIAATNN